MSEEKFSIITVCYNSEKTISQTIESLLNQKFTDFEYIIIDGNSKDKTIEIIKSYSKIFEEKGIRYKYISEKDKGIYDAMNKGIKLSRGNLIGIINSDDWYENDALENIMQIYKEKEPDIIYGLLRVIGENDKPEKIEGFYNTNGIGVHPTVFIKKEVYNKYGLFDLKYKLASDTELLMRLSKQNLKVEMIEKIISNFRNTGESTKQAYLSIKETNEIKYNYKEIDKKSKFFKDLKSLLEIIFKKYII